ncbi:ScbR family autoregulator-binding transcription factor [Actinomycetota bacterium Odt1-20B]
MRQERAARTRRVLLRAAAAEIADKGYEGSSLARICDLADISMGALTFHFASKDKLAQAVREQGRCHVGAAVEQTHEKAESPLRGIADIALALTRLVEEDVAVQATVRLARERPETAEELFTEWVPALRDLLHRAAAHGELRTGVDQEGVVDLVTHLVVGVEWHVRARTAWPAGASCDPAERVARVWDLVLPGIRADGLSPAPAPRS